MNRAHNLLDETVKAQDAASDPDVSAWVSANAGAGKTHVLMMRVMRLLLKGAAPERILCLTYTKAAAAEMQTRLFRTLGAWAMLPDPALRTALDAVGEPGADLPPDRLDHVEFVVRRNDDTQRCSAGGCRKRRVGHRLVIG